MKKPLLIVAAALAVAIVAAVVYFGSNLNALVARAIEQHGGAVTGTRVEVDGVKIALREGRGELAGLRVASPERFAAREAIVLGDIALDLDLGSVRANPLVVEELRVRAPVVHVAFGADGGSNIDVLRRRVEAAQGEPRASDKRLRIERFVLEEGRIEVDASALGLEPRSLALPPLRLDDIGGAEGVPPEDVAALVLGTVARQAARDVAASELGGLIEDKLGAPVTERVKGLIDRLKP